MTKASPQNTTHPQSEAFLSLFPKPDHKAPSGCNLEMCFRDIWDKSLKETPFLFSGLSAKSPVFDPLQAEMGGNDYNCKLYAHFKTIDRTEGEIAIYLGPVPYPSANGEFVLKGNRYIFPIYLRTIKQYRKLKKRLGRVKTNKTETSDDISDCKSEQLSKDDERKTDNLHIVLLSELLMPDLQRHLYRILGNLQKNGWNGDLQALRMWLRGWFRSGNDTFLHKILYQYGQLVDQVSPLNRIFQRNELSFYGLGGEHPDSTRSFHLRDVDDDDLYRICPVVTPQGHKVGMRLFMARRAKIDALQNAIIGPEQPEPGDSLSDSASLIPFIEHDDVSRALMGANMMKQAMILTNPDIAWIQTGWEKELAHHPEIPDGVKKEGVLSLGKNLLTAYMPWGLETFEDGIVISQSAASALTSVEEKTFWFDQNDIFFEEGEFCVVQITKPKTGITINDQGIVTLGTQVSPGDVLVHAIFKRFKDVNKTKILDVYIINNDIETLLGKQPDEVRDFSLRLPHNFKGRVTEIIDLSKKSFVALPAGIKRRIGVKIRCEQKVYLGDKISSRHGAKGVVVNILSDKDMPFVKTQTRYCNEDGCKIKEPHRHIQVILNPLGVTGRLNLGQLFETTLAKVAEKQSQTFEVKPFVNDWNLDSLSKSLSENGFSRDGKEQLYVFDGGVEKPLKYRSLVGPQYFLKLYHQADGKIQARECGRPYDYTLRDGQPRSGKRVVGEKILGSGQRIGEMETWALAGHSAWNILDDLLNVKSDDRRLQKKITDRGFQWNGSRRPQALVNLILLCRSMGLNLKLSCSGVDVTDKFIENSDGELFDKVSIEFAKSDQIKYWGRGGVVKSIDLYAQKKQDCILPLDKLHPDPEGLLSRKIFNPKKSWQMGLIVFAKPIQNPLREDCKGQHDLDDYLLSCIPVLPVSFRSERLGFFKNFQDGLNKLYRDIIIQNKRLEYLLENENIEQEIVNKAHERLYNAVKLLFSGGKKGGNSRRSIHSVLEGKKGLVRGHLAGKRADYSGRAVIIGDPSMPLNEAGIPDTIWNQLFPGTEKNEKPILLLNRQPSLHRNSIQAFRASWHCRGDVISLNPFVCKPFNADYDGDTIAVHVPRNPEAVKEADKLLPTRNLLSQANGQVALGFDKDIALAAAYLTYDATIESNEDVPIVDENELPLKGRDFWERQNVNDVETTVGRLIMRRLFGEISIKNRTLDQDFWKVAIEQLLNKDPSAIERFTMGISEWFDQALKDSGLSLSLMDFQAFSEAKETAYPSMLWLMWQIKKYDTDLENHISKIRGPMRRPGRGNEKTESIKSNLIKGHSEIDYFISAHGARAGLVDKGLITAHSGSLLRNWIYQLQDLYIVQADCGTTEGIDADNFEGLQILGNRFDLKGALIENVGKGTRFRSPLNCQAKDKNGHPGICQKCYGHDPSTKNLPEIGLPVGILAAQALGERVSQETLKSFHEGGKIQTEKKGLELVDALREVITKTKKNNSPPAEALQEIYKQLSSGSRPSLVHFEVILKGCIREKIPKNLLSNLAHSQALSKLINFASQNASEDLYGVVGRMMSGRTIGTGPKGAING